MQYPGGTCLCGCGASGGCGGMWARQQEARRDSHSRSENLFSNKNSNLYHDGTLTQFKHDVSGFKLVDHVDHSALGHGHVVHKFDLSGDFRGFDFGD